MSYFSSNEKIQCLCPVHHDKLLGIRSKNETRKFECRSCEYWAYLFSPKSKKPKSIDLRIHEDKCGCGRCVVREHQN